MNQIQTSNIALKGLIVNIILSFIKLISGILGNSAALIADGINSVGDCFSSIIVYIGIKIAHKPADENHPYGHYKAELISTIAIAILLSVSAFQIFINALQIIKTNDFAEVKFFTMYAALISIAIKYYIYRETIIIGKKFNSPSTIANAMDYKSDIFISLGTLVGVSASILGYKILDPLIAVFVAVLILKMAFQLILDVVSQIMDEAVEDGYKEKVDSIAKSVDGVVSTHFIRMRKSGAVLLMDLDLVINPNISFIEAHNIAHRVVAKIKKSNSNIAEVRVHFEPFDDGECR